MIHGHMNVKQSFYFASSCVVAWWRAELTAEASRWKTFTSSLLCVSDYLLTFLITYLITYLLNYLLT
jgi:hypothetical protein